MNTIVAPGLATTIIFPLAAPKQVTFTGVAVTVTGNVYCKVAKLLFKSSSVTDAEVLVITIAEEIVEVQVKVPLTLNTTIPSKSAGISAI